MAENNREILLKLIIDDKEAMATLKFSSEQIEDLRNKATGVKDSYVNAFKLITNEAMRYNEVTEESVQQMSRWLATQNLSEDEIVQTIASLNQLNHGIDTNSDEWMRNAVAIENISKGYEEFISTKRSLLATQKGVTRGSQSMNMALSQLGFAVGDASMVTVNFRMALMGISNNIPFVIQYMMQAAQEARALGTTFTKSLISTIMGGGGLILAINGLMLLLQILPDLFSDTTEEIKKQAEEVDKLANEYEQLTQQQIQNKIEETKTKLREMTAEMGAQYGELQAIFDAVGGYIPWPFQGWLEGLTEMDEEQQETYTNLINNLNALEKASARVGYTKDLENQIRLLKEQRETLDEDSFRALDQLIKYYEGLLNAAKIGGEDDTLNKEFEKAERRLAIEQAHQKAVAEIQEASQYEQLVLREMHLNEMINLYEKYGEDTTPLTYELAETQLEIEKNKNEAIKDTNEETLNEIGGFIKELDEEIKEMLESQEFKPPKILGEEELDRIRAESFNNEFERQRSLAEYEYEMQLKKYEDFKNFEEIKKALHEQYTTQIMQIDEMEAQHKLQVMSQALEQLAGVFNQSSAAYKALAIGATIIDTYRAATAALAPPPTGLGPVFGPALAGITIATGMANVAKIVAQDNQMKGFARGGVIVGEEGIPEVITPAKEFSEGWGQVIAGATYAAAAAIDRKATELRLTYGSNAVNDPLMQQQLMNEFRAMKSAFIEYAEKARAIGDDEIATMYTKGKSITSGNNY